MIADGDAVDRRDRGFERDRRELLRRGFTLGGAAIAASSIPLLWSVRNAFAQAEGDGAVLASAITLERVAVIAYDTRDRRRAAVARAAAASRAASARTSRSTRTR